MNRFATEKRRPFVLRAVHHIIQFFIAYRNMFDMIHYLIATFQQNRVG